MLKDPRRHSMNITFALLAAAEALQDAKWSPTSELEKERTGVSIGTGIGGIEETVDVANHIMKQVTPTA